MGERQLPLAWQLPGLHAEGDSWPGAAVAEIASPVAHCDACGPCLPPAAAAGMVASYLWSKPRFRYVLSSLLSKHLGLGRRRGTRSGLIPV